MKEKSLVANISCVKVIDCLFLLGLSVTKRNVQAVLKRSRVFKHKSWQKTLRCFSFPIDDIEGGSSPVQVFQGRLTQMQKVQYLSENWLETERDCQWWRLGMKLIRCCRRKDIETVQELLNGVANYNHSGKF